jgi:hypothetical protein
VRRAEEFDRKRALRIERNGAKEGYCPPVESIFNVNNMNQSSKEEFGSLGQEVLFNRACLTGRYDHLDLK